MRRVATLVCALWAASLWSTPALAVLTDSELAERGMSVLDGVNLDAFSLSGSDKDKKAVKTRIEVQGQLFTEAWRVDNGGKWANPYDVQFINHTTQPVKKGDVLGARVYLRAPGIKTETGEGQLEFLFQRTIPPYTVQFRRMLGPTAEWGRYDFRWRASEDLAAGEGGAVFRISYDHVTIDVGGLQVRNYGSSVNLDDLPDTRPSYQGREPDAAWRKPAADRIESIRKGGLTVKVADSAGAPLANADIHVSLKKHAFGFGNIGSRLMNAPEADTEAGKRWQEVYLRLFNKGVANITWRWWDEPYTHANDLKGIEWFGRHGITDLHGTHVIWAKWMRIPTTTGKSTGSYKGVAWGNTKGNENDNNASMGEYQAHVQADGADAARDWLRQRVRAHITEKMSALAGRITSCNVVNEHYDEHVLTDILGMDEMVEWFKLTQAAAPEVKRYINDYGVIGPDRDHEKAYCDTIKFLLDHGAPLQAIGEQSHFGAKPPGMARVERVVDRLAGFGLPIEITEFDVDSEDEQLQADYVRDYLTFMFSHPAVMGVTQWGFWQGDHWRPNGGLWRKDWSIKPAGRVLEDLLLKQWHTEQSGKTDAEGGFRVRGFLGQYEVQVTAGGISRTVQTTLPRDGATLTVKMQ